MALSEYEQRRLDEIERALHSEDPHFAGAINIGAMLRHRRLVATAVGVDRAAGAGRRRGPCLGATGGRCGGECARVRGDGGRRLAVPLGSTGFPEKCRGQDCRSRPHRVVPEGGTVPASFRSARSLAPGVIRCLVNFGGCAATTAAAPTPTAITGLCVCGWFRWRFAISRCSDAARGRAERLGFGCGTVLRQQDVVTGVGDRPDPHVPTARAEVLLMKPDAP